MVETTEAQLCRWCPLAVISDVSEKRTRRVFENR
jgi:hypothetical protein